MTKYASNAMLATKISFMNEMANICERVGADVNMVVMELGVIVGLDILIYAGVDNGGPPMVFPKKERSKGLKI